MSRSAHDRERKSSPRPGPGPAGRLGSCALLALAAAMAACVSPESQRLSCDDVYDANQVDFAMIMERVVGEENGALNEYYGKSCQGAPCHGADGQQEGLRLDQPKLAYEEMSRRADLFYALLASGEMPKGGDAWDDEDLKVFRSWYCAGAFPP